MRSSLESPDFRLHRLAFEFWRIQLRFGRVAELVKSFVSSILSKVLTTSATSPLFFQGSTQVTATKVTASKETLANAPKPSFLAGRGTFRAFCVVYGLWMLFLAAVVWQVVRR